MKTPSTLGKMGKRSNILAFSSEVPLRLNHLKKYLRKEHNIGWSEYLIMCAIDRIYNVRYFVTTKEIEEEVGLDRCWVYQQIRDLKDKKLVEVYSTPQAWSSNDISLTGWGQFVLRQAQRQFKKFDMDLSVR